MKNILIFSGTSEGRELAELFCKNEIKVFVSVATEYGEIVMEQSPYAKIIKGRMDQIQMKQFMQKEKIELVVDATHPFATEVTRNIQQVCKELAVLYYRLKRDTTVKQEEEEDLVWFRDIKSCAKALEMEKGNILLTTGSKELHIFTENRSLRDRLFVRVLPCLSSISICEENGIAGKQIIAMQGPFTQDMNEALLSQFQISVFVTKQTGKNGGFFEKIHAARNAGVKIFVIGNPEQISGYSFQKLVTELDHSYDFDLKAVKKEISLIGMGMGNERLLTEEQKEKISHAEIIFGASRLLEQIHRDVKKIPLYLAVDIFDYLDEEENGFISKIVVLFSGDTGFYSGADQFVKTYKCKQKSHDFCNMYHLQILPGISSLSYFSSRIMQPWDNMCIVSIHGKNADIIRECEAHEKTFFLLSGPQDIQKIGRMFLEHKREDVRIDVGYQLSYPEEKIYRNLSPQKCLGITEPGLYVCVVNQNPLMRRNITHGLADDCFIRNKVPMTKEEIREISISKLGLMENSILYDIGSGTGSISLECARLSTKIKVYAIEKNEEAIELLEQNKLALGIQNISCVHAEAPNGFHDLPTATHAFIGGSGGNLKEILMTLKSTNSAMHVVINAVTMETVSEMTTCLQDLHINNAKTIQVQVSRAKEIGSYHLFKAENPVFITAFCFNEGHDVQEDV